MKTALLAIILSLGIFSGALANDDSVNAHLANTLSLIFKTNDRKRLLDANAYYQTTIVYNGMAIIAFKSNSSDWVGFFKRLSSTDLPQKAQLDIARNFHGSRIHQVSMYINTDGDISYFAELSGSKKNFFLKIEADGTVKRFNCSQTHVTS